jgi:hypothetical protein
MNSDKKIKAFSSEKEMSEVFEQISPLKKDYYKMLKEFEGVLGIPDFLFFSKNKEKLNEVIIYELKLNNWRRALIQAYRYKSFCHKSFVVMDEAFICRAIKHIEKFKLSGIGLASINTQGEFKIVVDAISDLPYCNFYYNKLEKRLNSHID